MIRRREFITLLGGVAAAWPLGARAEQRGRLWRIGFLSARPEPARLETDAHGESIKGMRDFGYVEGKDFIMEWRFAAGKFQDLPSLAMELVALNLDVIVAGQTAGALALQKSTSTIPIVVAYSTDLIGFHLVASLAHPGSNITGFSLQLAEMIPKQLDWLARVVPNLSHLAVLWNPTNESHSALLCCYVSQAKNT
jgi:putative tryptophan/tyrosine transport system substrate-binding protein